ncbi:MAG: hypothetical protein GEU98_19770 [Pseudonocardiaceae bacterium]|nr:hypothetical protein [Pseudonocardiaceae bacterium]
MNRAAAILCLVAALGFGIPGVFGIRYFADTGDVWTFMGFPTYGEGPFENWGIETTLGLLVAFLVVCTAELVVAVLLWFGHRLGLVLSLALLPFEFLFWIGFALPLGYVVGVGRAVLGIAGWRAGRSKPAP